MCYCYATQENHGYADDFTILYAGCIGALEDEVEIPDIDLPLDWMTIVLERFRHPS